MSDFSIVFMGTPEFAVEILRELYEKGQTIKAVVTAPDKPAGRGQKMQESAVKQFAVAHQLKVLQPNNLKSELFLEELRTLNADLFVVVAFRMLPKVVWSMPPRGTINLHASLLPNYRGAAPINWAIINGETKTGVTTFFIEEEIDTGKVIDQASVQIGENETVGELYERLMKLGAQVMNATVEKIRSGEVKAIPQDEMDLSTIHPAPKIFKQDCKIDFTQGVERVHNFCRGLSPYPAAWCTVYHQGTEKNFKLFKTEKTEIPTYHSNTIREDQEGLLFPCADFYVRVLEIQAEGKKRMNIQAFLAGNSLKNHTVTKNPKD